MKFLPVLSIIFAIFSTACHQENVAETKEFNEPQARAIPATRLTSLYTDKLQCSVLPNPPQQHLFSYPPHVSPPALQSMLFKVCLKLDDNSNQIKLSETSQQIWQDFQCRVGYTPKANETFPYEFQATAISHRYTKNSPEAQQIIQKLSENLPNSEKIVELAEQKNLHENCDVAVAIIPRINSDMLNEIWHICYPSKQDLTLLCSEKTGCQCSSQYDETHRNVFDTIKTIY